MYVSCAETVFNELPAKKMKQTMDKWKVEIVFFIQIIKFSYSIV
jgi:hypothetical protein